MTVVFLTQVQSALHRNLFDAPDGVLPVFDL